MPQTCKIIYVDDDLDDRFLFKEAIRESVSQADVHTLATGTELLQILRSDEQLPTAIFLDVNMPVMNGFECLTRIRENHLFDGIKIYMISTSSSNSYIHTAKQEGANGYYTKPTSYNSLKVLISNCIEELL